MQKRLFATILLVFIFSITGCTDEGDIGENLIDTENEIADSESIIDDEAEVVLDQRIDEITVQIPEEVPIVVEEPKDLFFNGFTPAVGRGIGPPDGKNGPWSTRIMLASSNDGINFISTGESVVDQAGVPNLIVDHDGYLRLYYQAWQGKGMMEGNDGNFIAAAIKNPVDSRWYFHKVTLDRKFPVNTVDPSIVLLPDGRYRLYFMADEGRMSLKIFSALSDDGINFKVEDGLRMIPKDTQGIFDPMVLQIDSGWLMVAGGGGRYSAISEDGLMFSEPVQFKSEDRPYHAWAGTAGKDGYLLYGNFIDRPKFSVLHSDDGTSWRDKGFSLKGGTATDVGVAYLPDGTYMMAYLEPIE